jgi:glycosyltransferase involved in cell wall biosynthesis
MVDAVLCPSKAIAELAARGGVKREKLYHINNFIDENTKNNQLQENKQDYFLYVGRIDSEKGINYLIDAMKTLQKDISLHIVGSGTEEEYYKRLAEENNLDNIKFLGYKSGIELEEEYKNCIATILPCNWFENFPRSILESFFYGKPSIASKVGGIPEMIDNGKNGFIFEAGQANKLSELIKAMYSDKELSAKMGENARIKADREYNADDYANKVIDIYRQIINKN